MNISETLYQLRTRKKLSQENLAEVLGIDYTTYARYESGKTELKASQVKKLADFYNITLDDFYHFGEYSEIGKSENIVKEEINQYFKEASSINFKRSTTYGFGVLGTSIRHRLCKWGLHHQPSWLPH